MRSEPAVAHSSDKPDTDEAIEMVSSGGCGVLRSDELLEAILNKKHLLSTRVCLKLCLRQVRKIKKIINYS